MLSNENIKDITNDLFKIKRHTFCITPTLNKTDITKINILNKKKYIVYKYANHLLFEYLFIKFAKYNMIQSCQQNHIDIILRYCCDETSTFIPLKKIPYHITSILSNMIDNDDILKDKKQLYFSMLKYNSEITSKFFSKCNENLRVVNCSDISFLTYISIANSSY